MLGLNRLMKQEFEVSGSRFLWLLGSLHSSRCSAEISKGLLSRTRSRLVATMFRLDSMLRLDWRHPLIILFEKILYIILWYNWVIQRILHTDCELLICVVFDKFPFMCSLLTWRSSNFNQSLNQLILLFVIWPIHTDELWLDLLSLTKLLICYIKHVFRHVLWLQANLRWVWMYTNSWWLAYYSISMVLVMKTSILLLIYLRYLIVILLW